jgi:uridine phosphorylase
MSRESEPPGFQDRQYHIQCRKGDLAPYVLLPGDPQRVQKIASLWDSFHEVQHHREFRSVRGLYKKRDISSVSTGIGSPSAGIVVEELARIGCHTLIRVGSTGVIQDIPCGDLIITTGCVRFEGTSKEYICTEYPALSHYEVILSLVQACESLGYTYHLGIGATTDSFFVGQGRHGFNEYFPSKYDVFIEDLRKAGVLNFEMETASILTLSSLFGLRAGAVCAVFANRVTGEFDVSGEKEAGRAASEAVRILQEWDEKKEKSGKNWFYPSLLHPEYR